VICLAFIILSGNSW